jgi:hypothetical protein
MWQPLDVPSRSINQASRAINHTHLRPRSFAPNQHGVSRQEPAPEHAHDAAANALARRQRPGRATSDSHLSATPEPTRAAFHLARSDATGQSQQEPHAPGRFRPARCLLQCHETAAHSGLPIKNSQEPRPQPYAQGQQGEYPANSPWRPTTRPCQPGCRE